MDPETIRRHLRSGLTLLLLLLLSLPLAAQPFTFRAAGEAKEFRLEIGFAGGGKAAWVQYKGKDACMALELRRYDRDSSGRAAGQPDVEQYTWYERYLGKRTGEYGFSVMGHQVYDAYYLRYRDRKRFPLVFEEGAARQGTVKLLLHGVLVFFNETQHDSLEFRYTRGSPQRALLTGLPDAPGVYRHYIVADYNFDGYEDIAFSVPDAGMGVYREFDLWLYQPGPGRFKRLQLPEPAPGQCACFCDLRTDPARKILRSSCRGGARWWTDLYRFDTQGRLLYTGSREED